MKPDNLYSAVKEAYQENKNTLRSTVAGLMSVMMPLTAAAGDLPTRAEARNNLYRHLAQEAVEQGYRIDEGGHITHVDDDVLFYDTDKDGSVGERDVLDIGGKRYQLRDGRFREIRKYHSLREVMDEIDPELEPLHQETYHE